MQQCILFNSALHAVCFILECEFLHISHPAVKEQQKCLDNYPTQGSNEVELQANPSYVTVGPVKIQ